MSTTAEYRRGWADCLAHIKRQRSERIKAGLAAANKAHHGRQPVVDGEAVKAMHKDGTRPTDIAKALGVSRSTVYRYLEAN